MDDEAQSTQMPRSVIVSILDIIAVAVTMFMLAMCLSAGSVATLDQWLTVAHLAHLLLAAIPFAFVVSKPNGVAGSVFIMVVGIYLVADIVILVVRARPGETGPVFVRRAGRRAGAARDPGERDALPWQRHAQ